MIVRRSVLSVGLILVTARIASACQAPPVWDCQLGLQGAIATAGQPFTFDVTVSGDGSPWQPGGPTTSINVSAQTAVISWDPTTLLPTPSCRQILDPVAVSPPGPFDVTLDPPTAPDPVNPTTWHQQFVLDVPADAEGLQIRVYVGGLDLRQILEACIPVYTPAAPAAFPSARLVRPAPGADAGGDIPFELIIDRNGFDPDVPLRAWVERVNVSDAMDLFPLMPATLSTGHALPAGDSITPFTAHVHEPCICGMSNKFHVLLTDDTDFPLFESSLMAPDGISAISVDHAPMAFLQHVATSDSSGDGVLSACEPATITVRMIARNPWLDYEMDAVLARLPLPPGFTAIAGAAHFHDNPMDAVTPDAAEMDAGGIVSIEATQVVATAGRLGDRLSRGENPPRVFPDMYEVEVQLITPPEGLPEGTLTLTGVTTNGTPWQNGAATGMRRSETSAPLVIVVSPPVVAEISAPGAAPLLMMPDKTSLSWSNAAPAAVRWNVRRGGIPGLRSRDYGSCVASALASATWSDSDAVAAGGFFYLITGTACGLEGSAGADSLGALRVIIGAPCP